MSNQTTSNRPAPIAAGSSLPSTRASVAAPGAPAPLPATSSKATAPSAPASTTSAERAAARLPSRRPGREGGKRDTNRKERTDALFKAALTLFLERGIENVTVDEIAKAAGTAKGNFYRYASDKRDLVDNLLQPIDLAFRAAFTRCRSNIEHATTSSQLTAAYLGLALEIFEVVRAHPEVILLWLQESRAPAVGARVPVAELERLITGQTLELTVAAHRHGLLKKIPPLVSALAVVGAVERLLIAYLRDKAYDNPAEVVTHLVQLILEGLKS